MTTGPTPWLRAQQRAVGEDGECEGSRACLAPGGGGAARCTDCGGSDEPCCAYGRCDRGRLCVVDGESATCVRCGDEGEPCCAFGACDEELRCVATPGRAPTCR
ncbi:MAG: hypothetical protein IPF99_33975 [Deltaproteobacteria bacterium]|nr:hypothetical protein [Deltaproteobacteria bacterium]